MSLGETIYRLRTERNMSQGDLANALEVSRQSISKWENNSSIPELDKLIKLSSLFEVSMDELVLGKQKEKEVEAEQCVPQEYVTERVLQKSGPHRKTVALVLLCFGALVLLLLTAMGDFAVGLMFAAPFLLCGIVCLLFRKNVGLWCAWALYFGVWGYLRYAMGIKWSLMLLTFNHNPSVTGLNNISLVIAWFELICISVLFWVTVLRFRKNPLARSRRNHGWLIAGWIVYVLLRIFLTIHPFEFELRVFYIWSDWIKLPLLTALVTNTIRLIYRYKLERKEIEQ